MERKLKKIGEKIWKFLEEEDRVREKALKSLREISRKTSLSIKKIHQGDLVESKRLIKDCIKKLKRVKENLKKYPEIYYQGFLHQTEKEVIESEITLSIIEKKEISEVGDFDPISYLHGLSESIGEIRRYILDKMRQGETENVEDYLKIMDDIYFFLLTFEFPDAITRSLRKQIDYVRNIVEKTRGEVTTYYLFKKKEI
ncbi:MAG: haloacid dehalogenase [Candidatus Omnitrophica bacterium]|nr:haloacid dehalogenase [Candidatus Omnitrophota bacterium]